MSSYDQCPSSSKAYHPPPGHTLVFADQSGMNVSGHVMLGTMDVHHQWIRVRVCVCVSASLLVCVCVLTSVCLQLLEQLPRCRHLLQQAECLKDRISFLLGGAQVVQVDTQGAVQPITEFYSSLHTFHMNLMSRRLHVHPRSLQGLSMTLERYAGVKHPFLFLSLHPHICVSIAETGLSPGCIRRDTSSSPPAVTPQRCRHSSKAMHQRPDD